MDVQLDRIFGALADPTRRGILAALARGPQPVGELSRPFAMSLPGFMKHLDVLEQAGLLARSKEGRVVTCRLEPEPMREADAWLAHYRQFWEARLDALDRYLQQTESATWKAPPSGPSPRSRSSGTTKPAPKGSGRRGPTRRR
jgi:DNA-binding transcriptional ArsR family regulator